MLEQLHCTDIDEGIEQRALGHCGRIGHNAETHHRTKLVSELRSNVLVEESREKATERDPVLFVGALTGRLGKQLRDLQTLHECHRVRITEKPLEMFECDTHSARELARREWNLRDRLTMGVDRGVAAIPID